MKATNGGKLLGSLPRNDNTQQRYAWRNICPASFQQEAKLSKSVTTRIFPDTVWVRKPVITARNKIWFPHRGCKNLLLPRRVHDCQEPANKYINATVNSLSKEPIKIGTSVDTGMEEFSNNLPGCDADLNVNV
ncbi:uncharacterized protein LOC132720094 [Ruditapes philippinarum]|uniref:uncharacterized protein LOC132720094 n=1 Tax=Ruditapes philippinarum TaxID=129788 RepID=UPI00295BB505|nr:uncharacterized protein LOC132720094 [Ruditapes philippinarum]